jgi:hypothetical protein
VTQQLQILFYNEVGVLEGKLVAGVVGSSGLCSLVEGVVARHGPGVLTTRLSVFGTGIEDGRVHRLNLLYYNETIIPNLNFTLERYNKIDRSGLSDPNAI